MATVISIWKNKSYLINLQPAAINCNIKNYAIYNCKIIYNALKKKLSKYARPLCRELYIFNDWKLLKKSQVNGEKYRVHAGKDKISVKISIFRNVFMVDAVPIRIPTPYFLYNLIRKGSRMTKVFFKEKNKVGRHALPNIIQRTWQGWQHRQIKLRNRTDFSYRLTYL